MSGMVIALFLVDPPVVREFHKGEVHSYQIHLEVGDSALAERIDYNLWTKCKDEPKPNAEPVIEIKINDLRISAAGKSRRTRRAGAGTLSLEGAGLPDTLAASLITGRPRFHRETGARFDRIRRPGARPPRPEND